jgi:hypothetical protein
MAGVFVRPELVIEPGLGQMKGALLVLTATIGITFSLQARFCDRGSIDIPIRLALAAFALIVLLYPSERVAAAACLPVMLIIAYWVLWRRPAAALDVTKAPATAAFATSFAKPDSAGGAD